MNLRRMTQEPNNCTSWYHAPKSRARVVWEWIVAIIVFFIGVALAAMATGCANGRYVGPALTFGGTYTTSSGESFTQTVRIDPTFARQKK